MKDIIQKAIEGGYMWHGRKFTIDYKGVNDKYQNNRHIFIEGEGYVLDDHWLNSFLLDPLFWQSLGKACGWCPYVRGQNGECMQCGAPQCSPWWIDNAIEFHKLNLTEGWDKAVEWLEKLIKS